ncbi:hypothetical protein CC78DRAFT_530402, partial [Lojkania enalia]
MYSAKKFTFSLTKDAKPQKGKMTAFEKTKAEKEEKARREDEERKGLLAEFFEEHGEPSFPPDRPADGRSNYTVPQSSTRAFAARKKPLERLPETLETAGPSNNKLRSGPTGGFPNHFGGGLGAPQPQIRASSNPSSKPNLEPEYYRNIVAKVSNLPPDLSEQSVRQLFEGHESLKIVKVDKLPPDGPSQDCRPSSSMIITFDHDAKSRDLDNAMLKMSGKTYLGRGYYLHLDRYLGNSTRKSNPPNPFGARWEKPQASPQYQNSNFAPPPELGGSSARKRAYEDEPDRLVVTVNRPPDLKTMKLIHFTAEQVILGGQEFEAALMQDPRVQTEERFAWLYDQTHSLNRYYRYRLYQLACGSPPAEIFLKYGEWEGPDDKLEDEFASCVARIGCDDDQAEDMSDEDAMQKEIVRRHPRPVHPDDIYRGCPDIDHGLNPTARLLLLWLLRKLPCRRPKAREIAPITVVAMDNVSHGMEEVIQILISNILMPFSYPQAVVGDDGNVDLQKALKLRYAIINGLRIVNDIAQASSQEKGRAYKYRAALGKQMLKRKVFEYLDALGRRLFRTTYLEDWRGDVNFVLKWWNTEKLFTECEDFDNAFNAESKRIAAEKEAARLARQRKRPMISRIPQLDGAADETWKEDEAENGMDVDAGDDTALNEAMGPEATASSQPWGKRLNDAEQPIEMTGETAAARARRARPKAEDMFGAD